MTKKMTSAIAAHLSTAIYKRVDPHMDASGHNSSLQSASDHVASRAYDIYRKNGQQPGRCQQNWREAEQGLKTKPTDIAEHNVMTNDLRLTDLELTRLHSLLAGDIESTRVELHHTDDRAYKDQLKRRSEQDKVLLAKMEFASPDLKTIRPASTPSA